MEYGEEEMVAKGIFGERQKNTEVVAYWTSGDLAV